MKNVVHPIDWHYWKCRQEVELWEACLLSLNINPDRMQRDPNGWMAGPRGGPHFMSESFPKFDDEENYRKRLILLKDYLSNREHFSAGKINMNNPNLCGVRLSEFAAWALFIEYQIPDELAAIAQPPKIQNPPESQKAVISRVEEKGLTTTERNTLFKIILGMAIDSYGYDYKALRSDAPKKIMDDIARHGISVDDDTIRKWLRRAAEVTGVS